MVEDDQVDAAAFQVAGQLEEVFEGAAKAVELGDHELVAGSVGREQGLVQLRAAGELAGGLVGEDLVAARRRKGVVLGSRCWSRVETRP